MVCAQFFFFFIMKQTVFLAGMLVYTDVHCIYLFNFVPKNHMTFSSCIKLAKKNESHLNNLVKKSLM